MKKMTICLWFDGKAEEAAKFYASIFKNSKLGGIARYGDAGPGRKGQAMTVEFEVNGQKFLGLNGGPGFKFNESVSFVVACETQRELDYFWNRLSKCGKKVQCGWLRDKYGLSWQIVPSLLGKIMRDRDTRKSGRVMRALLQMTKLDIAKLKLAYQGR